MDGLGEVGTAQPCTARLALRKRQRRRHPRCAYSRVVTFRQKNAMLVGSTDTPTYCIQSRNALFFFLFFFLFIIFIFFFFFFFLVEKREQGRGKEAVYVLLSPHTQHLPPLTRRDLRV